MNANFIPLPDISETVISQLDELLGTDRVLTSFEERVFHSLDFSEEPGEIAMAVVKPRTAEDVAAIVRIANEAGVAVNTRGGAMSYTRGHVPIRPDTIMVDATGLNRILEINTKDRPDPKLFVIDFQTYK